jgi:hypothetical protein
MNSKNMVGWLVSNLPEGCLGRRECQSGGGGGRVVDNTVRRGGGGWTKQGNWAAGGSVDHNNVGVNKDKGGGGHRDNNNNGNDHNNKGGWRLQRYGPSQGGYNVQRCRDCAKRKYEVIFDNNIGVGNGGDDGNVSGGRGGARIIQAASSRLVIIAAVHVLVFSCRQCQGGQ